MRVIECMMLNGELDMLEIHLAELADIVDRFVVVEAAVTHTGQPKPLNFMENYRRFEQWSDKISYVAVGAEDLDGLNPWPREHKQRDSAVPMLEVIADDSDVILISDVDEFPPRGFDYGTVKPVVVFDQKMAMYAVDWVYPELHRCSVAATWRYVKANGGLAAVRDGRYGYRGVQGGWHLTWLGGLEAQRAKLATTCHTEMTQTEFSRIWSGACYERGVHHGDQGLVMVPADVDSSWPQAIFERRCPENWFRPRPAGNGGETA